MRPASNQPPPRAPDEASHNTQPPQKSHSHSPLPVAEPGALLPDSRTAATAAAASAASAAARALARWRLALLLVLLLSPPAQWDRTWQAARRETDRTRINGMFEASEERKCKRQLHAVPG